MCDEMSVGSEFLIFGASCVPRRVQNLIWCRLCEVCKAAARHLKASSGVAETAEQAGCSQNLVIHSLFLDAVETPAAAAAAGSPDWRPLVVLLQEIQREERYSGFAARRRCARSCSVEEQKVCSLNPKPSTPGRVNSIVQNFPAVCFISFPLNIVHLIVRSNIFLSCYLLHCLVNR